MGSSWVGWPLASWKKRARITLFGLVGDGYCVVPYLTVVTEVVLLIGLLSISEEDCSWRLPLGCLGADSVSAGGWPATLLARG